MPREPPDSPKSLRLDPRKEECLRIGLARWLIDSFNAGARGALRPRAWARLREAIEAFREAEIAAEEMAAEYRALLKLREAAETWLAHRTDTGVALRRAAHYPGVGMGTDEAMIAATDVVWRAARDEIERRSALDWADAISSASVSSPTGSAPVASAIVMRLVVDLEIDAAELMYIEALVVLTTGRGVRSGATWLDDPRSAQDSWAKAVKKLLDIKSAK